MSTGEEFEFDKSEDPLVFLNKIKKGKISIEEAKNLQQDYEKYLKEIRKGNKSAEQKKPESTESKITKNKNGENVPHLEITELVLVHCNLVNNDYQ